MWRKALVAVVVLVVIELAFDGVSATVGLVAPTFVDRTRCRAAQLELRWRLTRIRAALVKNQKAWGRTPTLSEMGFHPSGRYRFAIDEGPLRVTAWGTDPLVLDDEWVAYETGRPEHMRDACARFAE